MKKILLFFIICSLLISCTPRERKWMVVTDTIQGLDTVYVEGDHMETNICGVIRVYDSPLSSTPKTIFSDAKMVTEITDKTKK